ncbi:hypothetical protein BGZ98_000836 [Dissophora globulifera]|nr:hypothetical protein BGZ98_000836 [Dissophora globulifera]
MVKSSSSTPYCFVSGQTEKSKIASSSKYVLLLRQQPQRAKVCGMKERDRRPIDPPPIIQIKLADPASDRNKDYLQSPYLFMCCNLVRADDPMGEIVAPAHRALAGTVVSSLNRLKDVDNSDGGFFVFGDMSVRFEGRFCLRLSLLELIEGQVVHVMTTVSNPFIVYSGKTFPGMSESTFLSRSFSDQGVRIRIRKDHHVKPKKSSLSAVGESTAAEAMHSPPSSSHEGEAEHSDYDAEMQQPAKRTKSSQQAYEDVAYPQSHRHAASMPSHHHHQHHHHQYHHHQGYAGSRHVAIAARPKYPEGEQYSPTEPMDRTPPSSPRSHLALDSAPSRPRHNPYGMHDESRRYDGYHHASSSRQHPYYSGSSRSSHYEGQPYYNGAYPPPPSHPGYDSPRERAYLEHRRDSFSSSGHPSAGYGAPPSSHHHSSSYEHDYYSEGSPSSSSYGYHPSHPVGAAHSASSPSSASSISSPSVHSHPRAPHHLQHHHHHHSSSFSHPPPPPASAATAAHSSQSMHAGRHGFPASLLNEQEMEDAPPTSYTHGLGRTHSHGRTHSQSHASHTAQDAVGYHSRTPSMSSQHSDGNFSPPHPFSPPDSQMAPPPASYHSSRGHSQQQQQYHHGHAASSLQQENGGAHGQSSPPSALPSMLPSLLQAVSAGPGADADTRVGEKIQLPPIHTLSTRSPTMAPPTMHAVAVEHAYYAHQ